MINEVSAYVNAMKSVVRFVRKKRPNTEATCFSMIIQESLISFHDHGITFAMAKP